MTLSIVSVTEDTAALWGRIHNRVIPASPLSDDDVLERMSRHQLTLAYVDELVVGNATLRPPASGSRTSNESGLRFAQRMGFEEFDRYTVEDAEYADLWLTAAPDPAR